MAGGPAGIFRMPRTSGETSAEFLSPRGGEGIFDMKTVADKPRERAGVIREFNANVVAHILVAARLEYSAMESAAAKWREHDRIGAK